MSTESTILISNINTESIGSAFTYGEKRKGAGYNRRSDGLHTAVYVFDSFKGTIKIQGTLEMFPGDTDWVDISGTSIGGDSTVIVASTKTRNFTGNFVWIRAAYNVQDGTIVEIRYNH